MDPVQKQKQIDENRTKKQKYEEAVKHAINAAGEDANVRILLQHVLKLSGLFSNPVVINEQREITNALEYNVGRSSLYIDLRKMMSADTKTTIERSE